MTDYSTLTDEQLCERISEAREKKPKDEGFAPYFMQSQGGNWIHTDPASMLEKFWRPLDWLSWEYAGRLLEEMRMSLIWLGNEWGAFLDKENPTDEALAESDRPTRAICEAWLTSLESTDPAKVRSRG